MEAAPAPQITPALVAAALAAKAIVIKGKLSQVPARNLFLAFVLDGIMDNCITLTGSQPELRPLEHKISNYAVTIIDDFKINFVRSSV
jgi:hypothetical protein